MTITKKEAFEYLDDYTSNVTYDEGGITSLMKKKFPNITAGEITEFVDAWLKQRGHK